MYEDTSSEDSEDDDNAIVNYAKIIKKTARERLKEELNQSKMNQAMSSLGYIQNIFFLLNTMTDIVETHLKNQDVKLTVKECIYPQMKDIQMPMNCFCAAFAGARGSGKTYLSCKLVKSMHDKNYILVIGLYLNV